MKIACELGPEKVLHYYKLANLYGFKGNGPYYKWTHLLIKDKKLDASNEDHIRDAEKDGCPYQIVSEKELVDYIVTGKVPPKPEPPKVYFNDLKMGEKFRWKKDTSILMKCELVYDGKCQPAYIYLVNTGSIVNCVFCKDTDDNEVVRVNN